MSKVVKIGKTAIPPVELAKGMGTVYNVCQETVGTEMLRMGVCHHAPDMADMTWQGKAEEAFFVAKGSIRVAWNNGQGDAGETTVREGEQVFLPKGYQYTLKATGEPAVNVFAIAGGAPNVSAIKPEAGSMLQAAAKHLGH